MNYWLVQAPPKTFRILDFFRDYLNDYPLTTWLASRHTNKIEEEDIAFVWKAQGNDKWRGIIAREQVCCKPSKEIKFLARENPYWIDMREKKRMEAKHLFRCKTTKSFPDAPLLKEKISEIDGLKKRSFLDHFRGCVFRLDQEDGKKIDELINDI